MLLTASVAAAQLAVAQQPANVIVIMTDQQRADICGREGFPMEVTPFVDRMAREGAWFNRAYCMAPASVPSRTTLLTGRWPRATHVDSNHNLEDAFFDKDLFGVAREQGYKTAMVGKNHSYLTPDRTDYWRPYNHGGQPDPNKSPEAKAFDRYLGKMNMYAPYADFKATPFSVEEQLPYRMVTDALAWIGRQEENPFLMWLSFPEPHNPYQVCEPYYSMFSPDKIPPTLTDSTALKRMNPKYKLLKQMMKLGHRDYNRDLQKLRANYIGMIRLIDDQIERFIKELKRMGIYDNTVIVVLSDHGDYAGEYGLMKKGVGLSDAIARIPMVWCGTGIPAHDEVRPDHVSMADVFPTICEIMGAEIPMGVQGRSLWEMLQGYDYPESEFESVLAETGYGGQFYTTEDGSNFKAEGAINNTPYFFDCLNTWTQSGSMRMLRKGDWKLVYDMKGNGELYNMAKDPMEVDNLFGQKRCAAKQAELMADMMRWEISTADPLPIPRNRYYFKRYPHNYIFVRE